MNNLEPSDLVVEAGADKGTGGAVYAGELQPGHMRTLQRVNRAETATHEEKRRILRERARQLAQKRDAESEEHAVCLSAIGFKLGDETYAVDVGFVREVCPLRDLSPVPCTPPFVLGIINVRGQVVSVTDMKVLFGLSGSPIGDQSRVLILSDRVMEMGILVDDVFGEQRIPVDKIQSRMPAPKSIKPEYVRGITQDRLVVLDAAAILCDEFLVVHEEVGD
jgi:purine-binding chemotaxis protein CheW